LNKRIIVVDDENLARSSLASMIRKNLDFECEVVESSCGYDAIELCKVKDIETVVFMDIQMPGISGIDASQKILEENPRCIIYIVTAYDYFHYVQHAIEIGIKGYILKPPNIGEVMNKINKGFAKGYAGSYTSISHDQEQKNLEDLSKFKYPSKQEELFMEKIKFFKLDEARLLGYKILDCFFSMSENIPLMKEFICEFFVIFHRKVAEIQLHIDRSHITSFIERCNMANDLADIINDSRNLLEKYFSLISAQTPKTNGLYVQSALKLIEKANFNDISLAHVSSELALTPQYLCRIFKEQTGVNFIDFVIGKKINLAKQLLVTTKESIKSIGQKTGYDNLNYFSRVFKKNTGCTPREYRMKSALNQ
jgi:two-component system, response regulator YesN